VLSEVGLSQSDIPKALLMSNISMKTDMSVF
jgi:hypothetical protein